MVTVPLVLLAIPSLIIGWPTIGPMLFGNFFEGAIVVQASHDVLAELGADFTGPAGFLGHGLGSPVLYLALGGVAAAWYLYLRNPTLPEVIRSRLAPVHKLLEEKYYFDAFNERVIAPAARNIGRVFWRAGDVTVIDGAIVNGSARIVAWASGVIRRSQSGYLYHYAFAMVIGLSVIIGWFLVRG